MVIAFSVPALLMEGLRNHSFIIPRPKQIIKRETPEMQRKSLTEHPPTSCPEPAGRRGRATVEWMDYFSVGIGVADS